ncbi:MAG: glycerophosphodiester phosphodiesterase [Promethearchaeota archaeon]
MLLFQLDSDGSQIGFKKKVILSISKNQFFAINPFYKLVNKKFIAFAHKKGLKVYPWTVNSIQALKKLIDMGVDGILINDILRFKKVFN